MQYRIDSINDQIKRLEELRTLLANITPKVQELGLETSGYDNRVDYDNLPHEKVMKVIAHYGGKWTKSVAGGDGTKIDYTRDKLYQGCIIRCWYGEPPPSCQIVEVEEEVPEQVIPATTKITRKLVCKE